MGTVASLRSPGPLSPAVTATCERVLRDADARFSPYLDSSELNQLRRNPDLVLSQQMTEVLAGARLVEVVTGGAFSLTDPRGRVDTTGYVKGWAMGRAASALRAAGCVDFLLSVGGDCVAAGTNGLRPWQVAVQRPGSRGGVAEVLTLRDVAAATSGEYERGQHIWGRQPRAPRSGSVTVVGPRIDIADALATALWAGNIREPEWLTRFSGYGVLWLSGKPAPATQPAQFVGAS